MAFTERYKFVLCLNNFTNNGLNIDPYFDQKLSLSFNMADILDYSLNFANQWLFGLNKL